MPLAEVEGLTGARAVPPTAAGPDGADFADGAPVGFGLAAAAGFANPDASSDSSRGAKNSSISAVWDRVAEDPARPDAVAISSSVANAGMDAVLSGGNEMAGL